MIVTKHLYRFLNQKLQAGISGLTKAITFSYNCAQDNKIKKISIKVDDPVKHHDWPCMPTYSCESLLKIWLQVISGILTAKVTIQHKDDHVPYCDIHIPEEVWQIIDEGITSSFKDVSHD